MIQHPILPPPIVLPVCRDMGIGILGAGFIVDDCHLVAYRSAGLNVRAVASRQLERAEKVARRHGIEVFTTDFSSVMDDTSITVLDIAVPPLAQPQLIRQACQRSHIKGFLAQKPLAMDPATARELVECCERAGKILVVNQNMRYDHSVSSLKALLDVGLLGEPVLASIDMRATPHWMPWARDARSLATYVMSIHHLDTFRYWLGNPDRVLASTRPDPRTQFAHTDGINMYILEFPGGARATSLDDVWAGPAREGVESDIGIRWRVEGTEGLATGTIGWPGWPERVPSTIDFACKRLGGVWHRPRWPEAWFPDAFIGPMADLLVSLETGKLPAISGRDNLGTIALCEAVMVAAREHRVTNPVEWLV
ncbi:MAG: Gfo/Idh/MocA family protein [Planctomycetota bacterium]